MAKVALHGFGDEVQFFARWKEKEIKEENCVGVIWDTLERLEGNGERKMNRR